MKLKDRPCNPLSVWNLAALRRGDRTRMFRTGMPYSDVFQIVDLPFLMVP